MYSKIKTDLDSGIEKVKWLARLLSERVRIEMEIVRLSWQSEELKKSRDTLLRSIGEEVYLMRKGERGIYADRRILELLSEIEALEPRLKETVERMSEINRLS
jgi:seryl-tRNA synthetase